MKHFLHNNWELSFINPYDGKNVVTDVEIPSNIEPILVKLGLIKDYMPSDNKFATTDFDLTDFSYKCVFDAPELAKDHTRELVFEGIDTVATVKLNSKTVLECANMHRSYRLPVNDLKETGNELEVMIHSAELYARHKESDVFAMQKPGSLCEGNVHLRKARYAWGWDHAPRLLTSGIFKPVYLEDLPTERFKGAYLFTKKITDTHAKLGFRWEYTLPDTALMKDYTIRYTLFSDGNIAYSNEEAAYFPRGILTMTVPLEKIKLWWPYGYGEPSLCDFKLEMLRRGEKIAEWNSKWGIRTVRLFESDVAENGEFRFVVNNVDIFARGTNWKPLDPLPSLADAKLDRALALLTDLNCNMVRLWGGGYYESDAFFEYCDTHGLLVWHDLMLACEVPTRDRDYIEEARLEAIEIIKKLRNHPSIAVWCGDNEDDQNFSWAHGDGNALPSDQLISKKIFRDAVIENDPYRAYVASSPRMSDEVFKKYRLTGKKPESPERHLYETDSFYGGKTLRSMSSFFLGEIGPAFAPAASLYDDIFEKEKARAERLWDVPIDPHVRCTDIHQDDSYFIRWRKTGKEVVSNWFGREFSVDEWKDFGIALNIACATVYKDTIEYCRATRPLKTGVLWWSLLDMWQMLFNFSVVDSEFRPKLPYYWIKQAQQSFALIVTNEEVYGDISLYAANETLDEKSCVYKITEIDEDGNSRELMSGKLTAKANVSARIKPLSVKGNKLLLIEWTADGVTGKNHFVTGKPVYDLDTYRAWLDRLDAFYGTKRTY